ncbi:MAG: YjfB family protein [Candidatus Accumulibacter sp. UW26]|jgi:hypothetical protein
MEVTGIAAVATEMSQARTADAVQMAMFRKVLDVQEQSAMQLIEAASRVIPSNPPNLGNHIDTSA